MRVGFSVRIALSLCGISFLATLAAVTLQERMLARDLERAAWERLDRATFATTRLLEDHQRRVLDRHRATARTPEFRANLATGHVPTLARLAADLLERQPNGGAVLFTNRKGHRVAASGSRDLVAALRKAGPTGRPPCDVPGACGDVVGRGESFLIDDDSRLVVGTAIPLFIRGTFVGHLRSAEILTQASLDEWSDLCGASLLLAHSSAPSSELSRTATVVGDLELRVSASFEGEQAALENLRLSLLTTGAVALALAFVAAVPLARSLLRPIRAIEVASNRIRRGDLSTRLPLHRTDEFGDVARAFNTMLDRIESSSNRLERTQRIARLGGWSLEPGRASVRVTRELRQILGLHESGESIPFSQLIESVHPDDRLRLEEALGRCAEDGTPVALDHRIVRSDGSERVVYTHGGWAEGSEKARIEGTIQDITERKRVEEQVRTLAYRDGLTGLGNRREFAEVLEQCIQQSQQRLCPLAVIFLDLDDFKIVNDTLGHTAGDELLQAVATRVETVVQESGISGAPPSVHRLGGDEFAVILPQLLVGDAPLDCAANILKRIRESVSLDGAEITITASIGIARWPDEGEDVEALLRSCDTAMYTAKREGRGRFRVYDESMGALVERRHDVETGLRRALEDGSLEVFYQPKVELKSGRIVGFEALLRLNDPRLGPVAPDEFITVAENTGQILVLGEWVLRSAAEQTRRWMDENLPCGSISVNLSSAQVDGDVIVDTVAAVLADTGLSPDLLELEVTENVLLSDERRTIETLERLRDLGVSLALDDFGTGYSSLSYLRRLPIDTVKIDRSFVQNIEHNEQDRAIVESIVSMAGALGLSVVVEGVEDEPQRDLLEEIGCHMIQGYWYSAPVSAGEVPALLTGWKARRGKRKGPSDRSGVLRRRF